ncbi:MAG: CBS domain-containing protein [Desulfobacterales bacterium]|nr:MAG: CBS domain-containing protein [Desulfobacterales bacterium]
MKVLDLLREKARPVHTIASNQSIDDAVNLMSHKRVSALIVTENDQPVGIFAERDVFRFYLREKTTALSEIALQNAMTNKLIVAEPEDEVSHVMAIMIKSDIKHLPVIKAKKIVGMLTLNDLIEHQIDSLNQEIHHLKDYIDDLHDAGRD